MAKPLGERATWLVGRAHLRGHELLSEALAAAGTRPYDYRVLAALVEHGPVSQADIGRITGIDRSDVTASLNVLCDRGIAVRDPDPADRRRNLVSANGRGRAELRRLDAALDEVQERFLAPLSATEQQVFLRMIARLGGHDAAAD
jgi:DNA-binding MarR family transcriptional regulator